MQWWQDLFGETQHANAWQLCARAALVFVYGWLLVRIAGRRAFARWTAVDIVVAIVTGSNLSRALTGNADLFGTLAATTLMMAIHWALARAAARSPAISRLVEGAPVAIGKGGSVDAAALVHHGVSAADLQEALRAAGVESAADTRAIVLEPSGKVSVLKLRP
jgi:uncharacterized membrane protein YcaP (DUF421 family)